MLAWLQTFASDYRLVGLTVLARLEGKASVTANWIAQVADLDVLPQAVRNSGFAGIYSSGNKIFFVLSGLEVAVELLTPELFAQKLSELSDGRVSFEHESLTYDPANEKVSDPLQVRRSKSLRLRGRASTLAAAFSELLGALVEARQLGLTLSPGFRRYKAQLLARSGANPVTAEAITRVLFGQLTTLVEELPLADFIGLLRSRLVATSLGSTLDVEVGPAIRAAKAQLGRDLAPNPAVWIAVLAGSEPSSEVTTWLLEGSRFDQLRSQSVLSGAGN